MSRATGIVPSRRRSGSGSLSPAAPRPLPLGDRVSSDGAVRGTRRGQPIRRVCKYVWFSLLLAALAAGLLCLFLNFKGRNFARLVLYRVALPPVERLLCAIKGRVGPPPVLRDADAALCDLLNDPDITAAWQSREIDRRNDSRSITASGTRPPAKPAADGAGPGRSTETAAEIVARAHARHHFLPRIVLVASNLAEEMDIIGSDLFERSSKGGPPPACIPRLHGEVDPGGDVLPQLRVSAVQPTAYNRSAPARAFLVQGFALSNVLIVDTPRGLVLIDATEGVGVLIHILKTFRRVLAGCDTKPIIAVLVSHYHVDHMGGLGAVTAYNQYVKDNDAVWAADLEDKLAAESTGVDVVHTSSSPDPAAVASTMFPDTSKRVLLTEVPRVAHEESVANLLHYFLRHPQTAYRRAMKQFGVSRFLRLEPLDPPDVPSAETRSGGGEPRSPAASAATEPPGVLSAGIGHTLGRISSPKGNNVEFPTHFWRRERLWLLIDDLVVQMRHLPGETGDQICFYLPQLALFHGSDNFYFAFPNIYPLRGGSARSPLDWVRSLDIVIDYYVPRIDVLTLGHTSAVFGRGLAKALLQRYRDSIQFVHDQTIRLMNHLQDPDEIARRVAELYWASFPKFSSVPYTKGMHNAYPSILADPAMPFYGQVHWASKAVIYQQRGWFGGTDIEINSHKTPIWKRNKRLLELIEGRQSIVEAAADALRVGECHWALELCHIALNSKDPATEWRSSGSNGMSPLEASLCGPNSDDLSWMSEKNPQTQGLDENARRDLTDLYLTWRRRQCARMQTLNPLQHKSRFPTGPTNEECAARLPRNEEGHVVLTGMLRDSPETQRLLLPCLRRDALWCLARRELPSSGRNWYLAEALTPQQKAADEEEHLQIAHRMRQELLRSVPNVIEVLKSLSARFMPGQLSYEAEEIEFWIHLVDKSPPHPQQVKGTADELLRPVRGPGNTTARLVYRNQVLAIDEIDPQVHPRHLNPNLETFIEIWMTYDALRTIFLKTYPTGPVRQVFSGDIWFADATPFFFRFVQLLRLIELLLACEHD